ncbi:MAG: hypothetical protein ABIN36_01300 [Ferruginibacter sp.]
MKKITTVAALVFCLSINVDAQTRDSSAKERNGSGHNTDHNTKKKTKANGKQQNEDRVSRRDSALALPPEEESRRSPSSTVPPNTPQ